MVTNRPHLGKDLLLLLKYIKMYATPTSYTQRILLAPRLEGSGGGLGGLGTSKRGKYVYPGIPSCHERHNRFGKRLNATIGALWGKLQAPGELSPPLRNLLSGDWRSAPIMPIAHPPPSCCPRRGIRVRPPSTSPRVKSTKRIRYAAPPRTSGQVAASPSFGSFSRGTEVK